MVKYTQTIRRQIPNELFECVWPFCEIGAKRVNWINTATVFMNTATDKQMLQ